MEVVEGYLGLGTAVLATSKKRRTIAAWGYFR
jgi:hypothetical protein